MEPKIVNHSHGYYALAVWSYKDQVWKHWRGSKDMVKALQQKHDYWMTYGWYFAQHIKKIEGVMACVWRETKKFLFLEVLYDGFVVTVRMEKKNLLNIKITSMLEDFSPDVLEETLKRAILDNDFILPSK